MWTEVDGNLVNLGELRIGKERFSIDKSITNALIPESSSFEDQELWR